MPIYILHLYALTAIAPFQQKKPHEIRESAEKKCRMHYFCEKGAEMLDQEHPSYPDDGLWKGGLNTS